MVENKDEKTTLYRLPDTVIYNILRIVFCLSFARFFHSSIVLLCAFIPAMFLYFLQVHRYMCLISINKILLLVVRGMCPIIS